MTRILAIARNTLREAIRQRVALVLAFFGVGLVGVAQILAPLALGEGRKVVTDFGLAGSSALATLLAIVLGSTLLHKELERRTILAIMAKPIRRSEFLLGKFAGLWVTAAILLAGMVLITLGVLRTAYGTAAWEALGALALSGAELLVVTAIVVFFSSFSTPLLTAFFTAGLLLAGHFAEDLHYFGRHGASPVVAAATEAVYWLLPHLEVFNARGLVAHGAAVPGERILFASAYGAMYAVALLVAATAIFERREFR